MGPLLEDGQGHLEIDHLYSLAVRVKVPVGQTVAGDHLLAGLRNGPWVYATFDPATNQRDSLNSTVCNACHQQANTTDYLFTLNDLDTFAKQHASHYSVCLLPGRLPCSTTKP